MPGECQGIRGESDRNEEGEVHGGESAALGAGWNSHLCAGEGPRLLTSTLVLVNAYPGMIRPQRLGRLPLCVVKLLLGLLHGRLAPSGSNPRLVHALLSQSEVAASLARVPLRCTKPLFRRLRARSRLAKPHPRLLESLAVLLAPAFMRRLGLGGLSDRPSLPSRLLFRHSLGERREQLETCGLQVGCEPASREQLPALTGDSGCLERPDDPVQSVLVPSTRLGKDAACGLAKAGERITLRPPRLVEASWAFPRQKTLLGFAQPMARVEEKVDLSALLSSELIDRPR
jgi:hypothetical protein